VVDPQAYREWAQPQFEDTTVTPEKVATKNGCVGCHSTDGTRKVGPSFKGLYGKTETLEGGVTVTVDDGYIRESINAPAAKIVAGYAPTMPPFQGKLSEEDLNLLIDFIKSFPE
jgi:cytochrome c oxidase subunit II